MKKVAILLTSIMIVLILAACSAGQETAAGNAEENNNAGQDTDSGSTASAADDKRRLAEDYAAALPVATQLALGTLQLEDSDLVVDETLAAELLPLWQAFQSLSNSDTAAGVEIDAVVNQIQDTMNPDQIIAIAAMKLTEESVTALIEEGGLAFARGGGRLPGGDPDGGAGGGFGGRGFGGGIPGGGPPGGGFPGGFGGGADLSEDDIATRRAGFAEEGFGAFQERALTGAVIRLLEVKTGETVETDARGLFRIVFDIVDQETGLSSEELREKMAEGLTLAEIVVENGGDVEIVRASLVEAFGQLPNAADLDVEGLAADWLGLGE